jgi:hypothetical protein
MSERAARRRDCVVHLYALSLNETAMLGFFFRHYDEIVDRYFIYDDGSTDGTLEMLRAHPKVECRRFERLVPDSFTLSAHHFHENVWKQSRGRSDWVFLTPIDERRAYLIASRANCRSSIQRRSTERVTQWEGTMHFREGPLFIRRRTKSSFFTISTLTPLTPSNASTCWRRVLAMAIAPIIGANNTVSRKRQSCGISSGWRSMP